MSRSYLSRRVVHTPHHNFLGNILLFKYQEKKLAETANSIHLDAVVRNEPPHLDIHCLPSTLEFSIWYCLDLTFFENLQTQILSSAFW